MDDLSPLSWLPRGPLPSPTLCRICSGPPASTPASACATSPSTAFLGRCSSSLLSGMARVGRQGGGEVTHGQQGPLTTALRRQSLHFPVCGMGTAVLPPGLLGSTSGRVPGTVGLQGATWLRSGPWMSALVSGATPGSVWQDPALLSLFKHQRERG